MNTNKCSDLAHTLQGCGMIIHRQGRVAGCSRDFQGVSLGNHGGLRNVRALGQTVGRFANLGSVRESPFIPFEDAILEIITALVEVFTNLECHSSSTEYTIGPVVRYPSSSIKKVGLLWSGVVVFIEILVFVGESFQSTVIGSFFVSVSPWPDNDFTERMNIKEDTHGILTEWLVLLTLRIGLALTLRKDRFAVVDNGLDFWFTRRSFATILLGTFVCGRSATFSPFERKVPVEIDSPCSRPQTR
mmetsp:Transcript_40982/g.57638  ORF Transcript_40982/g.57638 Transcript_40982/m.57638 type:complete len:245 (-) Transcript_40982:397-1131(-)